MANVPISAFTVGANTTGIGASGYSLTGSAANSYIDLAGTWNTSGTPTAIKLNITDTASNANSLLLDLQTGGTSRFRIGKQGLISNNTSGGAVLYTPPLWLTDTYIETGILGTTISGGGQGGLRLSRNRETTIAWGATASASFDCFITSDAAQTLAQRNSTNAQTFRVYNTFTDASNYERGKIEWASNVLRIGTEKAGTGTARALELQTDGTTRLTIAATGTVSAAGDIGWPAGTLTGAGMSIAAAGSITFGSGGGARTNILANAAGNFTLKTAGSDDFGFLMFGGTTSSFPALKRSTTSLQAKLADDTGFTNIQGKLTTETAYTAGAPTATGYLVLYDSTGTAYKVPAVAV